MVVLAAFTVFTVAALAMPRPDSTDELVTAYADLTGSRGPESGRPGMIVADHDKGSMIGSRRHDGESDARRRIRGLFTKTMKVCTVTQAQMELIEEAFHVEFKTIRIHGVETKVMIIHNVRNPHVLKKLLGMLGGLQCKDVHVHVSWIVFIFNPHMS